MSNLRINDGDWNHAMTDKKKKKLNPAETDKKESKNSAIII